MTEHDSRIIPFKNRLFQLFNASSSQDDPQRRSFYYQQNQGKKKVKTDGLEDTWEQESQSFFDDFISLDEEKITHERSREKKKKALENKVRQSRNDAAAIQETHALEDTFKTHSIAPEITEKKLELSAQFMVDLDDVFRVRLSALHRQFDLFSIPTLQQLKTQGFQDKFIRNLLFIRYFHSQQSEILNQPRAMLYLQLQFQFLDLPMRLIEMEIFIEKYLIDVFSFESLVNQTLHYIERNLELFQTLVSTLQTYSREVMPVYLKKLRRGGLDLSKRLARKHLDNRYLKLKAELEKTARHLQTLQRNHQSIRQFLIEKSDLLEQWHKIHYNLCAVRVLAYASEFGYPLQRESILTPLKNLGILTDSPEIQQALQGFSLEFLEKLRKPTPPSPNALLDYHFYPQTQWMTKEAHSALVNNELNQLEKWSLYKAQHLALFQRTILDHFMENYYTISNLYTR